LLNYYWLETSLAALQLVHGNALRLSGGICPGDQVAWVFPQAPMGQQGASEWWHLDFMKWMMAAQQGGAAMASLLREKPDVSRSKTANYIC